ncbi:MAG TPA: metallophosphoesterase, partial [Candidatus Kapabacteria bacterium]|nr:metallophosphoesterase [Candidatus Kapabacteria bacterium]
MAKASAKPAPKSNGISKTRRPFGDPVSYSKPTPRFIPIPKQFQYPGPDKLEMDVKNIVPVQVLNNIIDAGQMVVHIAGDTGGVKGTETQDALAEQMEAQITNASDSEKPSFLYHVGDVVYYNGISTDYDPQFYEPYQYYPAPIVAIPGNHDGDNITRKGDPSDPEPSLTGFMMNFCDTKRQYHNSPYRNTMNQPWPYWTLNTPFATFIGLYSNVDGSLDKAGDKTQYNWLVKQLHKADAEK